MNEDKLTKELRANINKERTEHGLPPLNPEYTFVFIDSESKYSSDDNAGTIDSPLKTVGGLKWKS